MRAPITQNIDMEPLCKIAPTPVGNFPGPMDPGFAKRLAPCKTNEDLFYLCKSESGFIDPDAFNEIRHRGLWSAYEAWLDANSTRVVGGYKCRSGKHLWWGQTDAVRCCDGIHTRALDPKRMQQVWVRKDDESSI